MTREEFFKKFELFAELPDAVAKMRELILTLAVTGRLVAQSSSESGAKTINEIIAVRDANAGTNHGRQTADQIPAGDEHPLPGHWARTTIGEVCSLQTGATPSRTVPAYFGGDIPWLVSGDINNRQIFECDGRITELGLKNSNCKVISANSVLIALNGQGRTRATVAILRIPAALNQSLVAIVPNVPELLIPEFVYWNLRARYRAIREITGDDQRRGLNMKLVGQLTLPVPPTSEQKRIVAKVDELMALCDQLEAQQKERETRHAALACASLSRFVQAPTSGNLTFLFHNAYAISSAQLRKSILDLAVQGMLVPSDRDGGEPPMVSMEELVGRKNLRNGLSLMPTQASSAFVCLPLSAMKGATIDCSLVKPIALHPDRAQSYLVKRGDVFIMRGNGSKDRVGLAGIVRSNPRNVIFPDLFIHVPLPTEKVDSDYFLIAWNCSRTRVMLESFAKTTSGIWKVNQGHIAECEIPLPPLPEQRRIVAKVDQLLALVHDIESQLAVSRTVAAKLTDEVVRELAG